MRVEHWRIVGQGEDRLRRHPLARRPLADDDADLLPVAKWDDDPRPRRHFVAGSIDRVRERAEQRQRERDFDKHATS